jgi:hypothetical protein
MHKTFALLILCATAATAAVFDHVPTDGELVDRSDLVVVGTIRGAASHVRADNGWVVTDYELAVDETLKGVPAQTVTVSEVGGVAGDRFTVVSDGVSYKPGEHVLVFLRRIDQRSYVTTAMQYGKFEFARNAAGAAVVVRANGDARMADTLEDFVQGGKANATTKLRPMATAFAPKPAGAAPSYCVTANDGSGTFPIRWPGGESGLTIHFKSNAVDPGGIIPGAAEWTNEPNAFINLAYDGADSVATGTTPSVSDGVNGIYLNYTGAIPGNIPCADSVACTIEAGSGSHVFNGDQFLSIADADIMIFPSGMGSAFAAVIVHEFGHAIGFRHSNAGIPFSSQAVMNSTVSLTTLQQWDRDADDTVYGNGPPCQGIVITQQPQSGTVPQGQSAQLQVLVSGTNPSFQWYDGTKPDTSNPVGGNSNTFTTPPINSVKSYWVRITNACSTVDSNTVTITPQAPPDCQVPVITQQPSGGTINSGQQFTLGVQATGTAPFSIQWYEGQPPDKSNPVPGATSATFQTPVLTQTKTYWVDILNACGEAKSSAATVNVTPIGQCNKPTFTIQPQGFTGVSGQPAILFALASGPGTILYQWFQGNVGDTSAPLPSLGASNTRWVSQLFVDVLGRLPSAGEVSTLVALLGGSTRTTVALSVLTSTEYRTSLIGSFYAQYLHRAPSAAEVSFFLPMFAASFTDEQVASQIIGSPEYFVLAGGTNSAFVTRLFNDVLGRAPSPIDLSFYVGLLGSSSRSSVALSILNSAEARTRLVQRWFAQFLRRSAAGPEVAGLLPLTDEQAMASILGSDEYFNFPSMLITPALTKTSNFWVRASNTCGSTDSTTATVTIPCNPPVIVTPPGNTSVNVGQSPILSVNVGGVNTYQWFVGPSGVESNPIAGATGPVLNNFPLLTTGVTQIWVKVSNACGSANSAAANVTVNCAATRPTLTAPPAVPSSKSYPVSWSGNLQVDAKYELQESTVPDFSANVNTLTIADGTSRTVGPHGEITKDTRFYYRVRSFTRCPSDPSAYSNTASVLVTAPLPRNLGNYSFTQLPCTGQCFITQLFHIDGFGGAAGKTALDGGDGFNVTSDKPWITVSPSTGTLPADGIDVTMTIDASQLEVGSTQASLIVNRMPGAAKIGVKGNTPTTTPVPVNVSTVAPVTAKPKDGNAPLNALLIPAVAHADGIGTRFVSDMRLTNTAAQSITYDITFTPSNIDGTTAGKQITLTVAAGSTTALNDIVKDWYGSGVEGEVGIGTLEIRPRNYAAKTTAPSIAFASVAASRTYAVTSTGTFGQFIPALPVMNFLAKASNSVISLQQLAQSPAYRTNLGLVEGLGQPADVLVKLFDDHGTLLAQRPLSLRPFEAQQTRLDTFFNGFTVNGAALTSVTDGRVEVSVSSDGGRVTAYASVLDNATTDPLLVFPVDPANIAAKRYVVPGVAEFESPFSNFHTDMRIYNAAAIAADVTLNFSGSTQLPAVQRTIPAGQVLAVDNVLGTLWNATGGGAVTVTTSDDSQLVVTARTFSRDANGGTFGQFIPGVTATDAVGVGDRSLQVVQLEQSPSFRSNLGMVEVTGNPVTVEILGFTPESKVAAHAQQTLAGGQFIQLGNIFSSMGFGDVYNGRISIRAIGGTGRVAAYGSVVDARTADPTYVPAQ